MSYQIIIVALPVGLAAVIAIMNGRSWLRFLREGADGAPDANLPVPFVSVVLCLMGTALANRMGYNVPSLGLMLPAIVDAGNWWLLYLLARGFVIRFRGKQ